MFQDDTNQDEIACGDGRSRETQEQQKSVRHPDIQKRLTERFYIIKEQGGQRFFYDTVSGLQGLTAMNLMDVCIQWEVTDSPSVIMAQIRSIFFRSIALDPVYAPNKSPVVIEQDIYRPNIWRKPEIEPDSNADSGRLIAHFQRLLGSDEKVNYVLDYIAFFFQRTDLSQKPHAYLYLYSKLQGYGKSFLCVMLEKVFGNTAVIKVQNEHELLNKSGTDLMGRTFCFIDEGSDRARQSTKVATTIKSLTSGSKFYAERKYENAKERATPAGLIMASNHPPQHLEQGDRRAFVAKWEDPNLKGAEKDKYFEEFIRYMEAEGYRAFASLLKRRDLSQFNLAAPPPITPEKKEALGLAGSEVEAIFREFFDLSEPASDYERYGWFQGDFDDFKKNNRAVSDDHLKHLRNNAGMTEEGPLQLSGSTKRFRIWLRPGFRIDQITGKPTSIVSLDGKLSRALKAEYEKAFHP